MSQPRVTDFFSRSKRATSAARTASKQRSGDCPSAVHREFLRVIQEASATDPAEEPRCPASPKRTAEDAHVTLGVCSATTEHSTAKKRRPGPAHGYGTKKTARKKLHLPGDELQAMAKEELVLLKARLQGISKHAGEFPRVPPSSPGPPLPADNTLKVRLTRARELAAHLQSRKEEQEAAAPEQSEAWPAEQPAHQRYHSLAQPGPPSLSLPYAYKMLAEMFRSMDTVVAMLFNRRETATFTKIKQGVQDMMHRRFEESHVAQIKMVFPEAFTFRQEKNVPTFNSSLKKSSYQLTVEPRLPSDQGGGTPVLSASRLLERRRIFQSNLLSMVKQHHKVFLSSLVPPLFIPEDKLTRWHPRFNVDSVPAVQADVLPQAPPTERTASAQEVLDKARTLLTPKMEKALVSLALQTEASSLSPDAAQTPVPPVQVPASLKGVSQSLVDRIRAKEAQKLQVALTRNADHEERLLMMSRLGELARILRSVFVAEKKPALIMEVVCNRMVSSYRSALSTGDMEKHIHLLAEVAPDWLTILAVRKDSYLKLNKSMELSVLLERLRQRLRDEERLPTAAAPSH